MNLDWICHHIATNKLNQFMINIERGMLLMIKQMHFYATEDDKVMIADILNNVFGQLFEVPLYKTDVFVFDEKANEQKLYLLVEESRRKDIVYDKSKLYDGTIIEPLDLMRSPVLEHVPSCKNLKGELVEGHFYCCSHDSNFSKKVSKFITKLKKEFRYVKKYRTYISSNIDLSTAKFDCERIITKEELS